MNARAWKEKHTRTVNCLLFLCCCWLSLTFYVMPYFGYYFYFRCLFPGGNWKETSIDHIILCCQALLQDHHHIFLVFCLMSLLYDWGKFQTMKENWKEIENNNEVPAGYEPSWILLIQPGQPALIVAFIWSWSDDPGATLIMTSWEEFQQGDFRDTQW